MARQRCQRCGRFTGGRKRRFCGPHCWKKRRAVCEWCKSPFIRDRDTTKCCGSSCATYLKHSLGQLDYSAPDRQCVECKGTYAPTTPMQRYCTESCSNRFYSRRRRELLPSKVSTVPLQLLYDRQGGRCGICGEPVDLSIRGRRRDAVSRDHIQRLLDGGKDTPDNVRLTHYGCNSLRGQRDAIAKAAC